MVLENNSTHVMISFSSIQLKNELSQSFQITCNLSRILLITFLTLNTAFWDSFSEKFPTIVLPLRSLITYVYTTVL